MKIKFKDKVKEGKFKEFVCKNKLVLEQFFAFGKEANNPFVAIAANALSGAIDVVCPDEKK